jgi:hypothetical protein
MVFLRQRRQANAPNHCSHCMKFFINVYGHAVAAMPFAVIPSQAQFTANGL